MHFFLFKNFISNRQSTRRCRAKPPPKWFLRWSCIRSLANDVAGLQRERQFATHLAERADNQAVLQLARKSGCNRGKRHFHVPLICCAHTVETIAAIKTTVSIFFIFQELQDFRRSSLLLPPSSIKTFPEAAHRIHHVAFHRPAASFPEADRPYRRVSFRSVLRHDLHAPACRRRH